MSLPTRILLTTIYSDETGKASFAIIVVTEAFRAMIMELRSESTRLKEKYGTFVALTLSRAGDFHVFSYDAAEQFPEALQEMVDNLDEGAWYDGDAKEIISIIEHLEEQAAEAVDRDEGDPAYIEGCCIEVEAISSDTPTVWSALCSFRLWHSDITLETGDIAGAFDQEEPDYDDGEPDWPPREIGPCHDSELIMNQAPTSVFDLANHPNPDFHFTQRNFPD